MSAEVVALRHLRSARWSDHTHGQRPQPTIKQFVTVADGTESEVVFTLEFKPTK